MDWKFIDGSEEFLEQVAQLFELVFNQSKKPESFLWKYRINKNGSFYGVHSINSEGKLISHVAAIPVDGILHNKPVLFFQFVDAMVHPDYRGNNLLTKMIHRLYGQIIEKCGNNLFLCYVFPGPVSSVIGQKHGWLHVIEKIRDKVLKEDFSSWWLRKTYRIESFRKSDDLSVFFKQIKNIPMFYDFGIIRKRKFLEWRFVNHPDLQYEYNIVYRFGSPVGWFITLQKKDQRRIVDYNFSSAHIIECIKILSHYYKDSIWWIPDCLTNLLGNFFEERETPIDLAWIGLDYQPLFKYFLHKSLYFTMADIDIY